MATPIGTLGTIPTLTVGGRVFTDLTNLIILGGACSSNAYTTLRLPNASAGYQVTSGKTLTQWAVRVTAASPSTTIAMTIGYGDSDVGINSASAPTNSVDCYGSNAISLATNTGQRDGPIKFTIAATKYPSGHTAGAAGMIQTYGYET